jgi:hypothetical protein
MKTLLPRFILSSLCLAAGLALGPLLRAAETPPATAPVMMTEELMQRLIKFARTQQDPGSVVGKIALILDLSSDGTKDYPLQLLETERPEGTFFGLPLDPDSKDILVLHKTPDGNVEAYLTDSTARLRAAAVADGQPAAHLITNEKAAAKYEAALSQLAREAAEDLPPTKVE